MGLLLQAVDVVDRHHWRWLLVDGESRAPLADHQVALDPAGAQAAAFENLYSHVRWNADPQRRTESETELVALLGAWIGEQVLGTAVGAAIVDAAPVTVRVVVPPQAEFLLFRPLELAHVDGTPLALRGEVTLVFQVGDDARVAKAPVGDALRMLAVFSLPTETSVLALRRERYELSRLVRRVLGRQRRVIELEVLQYGVTRDRLATIMESGGGWDVLHLSGHGGAGEFLLEDAAGSPDPISTPALLQLLRRGRHRIKLAVVSACQSAAATTAETLRWLRLDEPAEQLEAQARDVAPVVGGVARELARELGCAVVAMRYPVADDFAVDFSAHFYQRLFDDAQPVDSALARAVLAAAGPRPSAARPAISAATPAVFGSAAIGMQLRPPTGEPTLDPQQERMSGFPDEPERFVGRGRAMATASAALASRNEHTGVLFHGMAGAGKTACALELAYRHQNVFAALAFWSASAREEQWQGALESLAGALEAQLDGFTMLDKITNVESLARFLPRLNRWLEGRGLLLVLDNLETLLTPAGGWRDPRWELLMPALLGHRGESRVILTSRIVPAGLDLQRVLVEPVHALSRDEAVLLARELPNLRALLHADPGPVRDGGSAKILRDRELVRDVLHVVQGHPKMLELADAAAADRDRLGEHLAAARARADEHAGALTAFLRTGLTDLDAGQLADALDGWTRSAMAALPEASRLLLQFLACLEEDDRMGLVLEDTWPELWRRLERIGDPPSLDEAITPVVRAALVHADGLDPANLASVLYRLHPGVGETVRAQADPELRDAVARALAAYWCEILQEARSDGAEASKLVCHAGLAATPYLIQIGEWHHAGTCLEVVWAGTESPSAIQTLVPDLRRVAAATGAAKDLALLGTALSSVDPREAETLLRDSLQASATSGDFAAASVAAGRLAELQRRTGRLHEALETVDITSRYTVQAGLGPWTQLNDLGGRLQILSQLGQHEETLTELPELRRRMAELSEPGGNETVTAWSVREMILRNGLSSALALNRWEDCLSLNEEIIESMRARHADLFDLASASFYSIGPLIALGRVADVTSLMNACQRTFEDAGYISGICKIFSLRALLADRLRGPSEAVALQATTIRLAYTDSDPTVQATMHYQLANYLWSAEELGAAQRAHRLAAALIFHLIGAGFSQQKAIVELADEVGTTASEELPATVAQVTELVERWEGVCFQKLLERLSPGPGSADAALVGILEAARALAEQRDEQHLEQWEPMIVAVVAAQDGEPIYEHVATALDQLAEITDWGALVAALRRIIAGERDEPALLVGLDSTGTAIVREVLSRIGRRPEP